MHTLGLECAATERYDTHVPYMLIDILNEIQNDAGGDWEYWRHRGLIEQVRDVLTRYGDVAESGSNKAMCLSRIVGFAWQVGRYDLGRAALDKLDGKYDADAFAQTFTIPARTVSGTYAFTGPLANALKQAEESAAAGHSDQAIAAYKDLATKTPGDDQASIWLHGRAQELTWQKLFDAGQWIDLMPHDGLAGWYVVHGSFDAYNNAIIGTAKGIESAHIVCGVKFGRRWELRLKSEVLAGAGNAPIRADAEAGVCFCLASDVVFDGIFTRPNSRLVASYTNGRESGTYAWRLPQPTSFLVRLWDGHGDAYLDDRVFLTYRALGPLSERPDNRIALGSSGAAVAATKFKFSDIQIRKLTAEPPHAPSQP
jgi:hypothetical protein